MNRRATKTNQLHAYADDYEKAIADELSELWGISVSGVIKRLLRERKEELSREHSRV